MKFYSKITSERASKGQGGNKFLDIEIFTTSKDKATHRIHVFNSIGSGDIIVKLQEFYFGDWRDKYIDTIFLDSSEKGKKQKGEMILCSNCEDFGRGKEPQPDCTICNC